MNLYGFFNATTGAWLDNDFQIPHFADINALIAARFAGDADAFAAQHGDPAQWSRRAIEETQMRDIITPAVPTLYATLTISGGDGKRPPCLRLGKASQNTLRIEGDVRMAADDATTVVPISMAWRITVCKVRSEKQPELVDSFPVDVALVNGAVAIVDFTVSTAGVYMISDADFDEVDGALVGQSGVKYHVELVGGAKFFKAL